MKLKEILELCNHSRKKIVLCDFIKELKQIEIPADVISAYMDSKVVDISSEIIVSGGNAHSCLNITIIKGDLNNGTKK